ncbi:DUF4349 domain-containing protein [Streptomyces sp. NPDC048717]|uniref:DUF4349 domain-containing protein n=1 Tax=Streptomyces sp. NPDC048717 TaxID=3154928 RepID=UPI00341423D6
MAALLTGSLVLTGCAGSGGASDAPAEAKAKAAQPAQGAEGAAADRAAGPGRAAAAAKPPTGSKGAPSSRTPVAKRQHIIRTADLSVRVRSVEASAASARELAAKAGGRVETETTQREDGDLRYSDESLVTSRLVLRVPEDHYDEVLAELAGSGELLSRKADAKDVTDQVVDVESRIATQRASVARVRKLMDQATRLSDVVSLEGELSRRQADLEALLAQQTSLRDRTSLAGITLTLSEKRTDAPAGKDDDGDRPGIVDSLAGGWHALVASVGWLLVVLAALAPWLGVAALAYAVWRWLVRPRLRRRSRAEFVGPVAQVPGAPFGGAGLPHWPGHAAAGAPGQAPAPVPAADPGAEAPVKGSPGAAGPADVAGSPGFAGPSVPASDGESAE